MTSSLNSPNKAQTTRAAFTVVELLVVVGVIAALSAVVLSAVTSVKKSAESTECMSNLRQLGIASLLYSGDHNQMLFPYVKTDASGTVYWHGKETISPDSGEVGFDSSAGPLVPYLGSSDAISACPSIEYDSSSSSDGPAGWGYGYNWWLGGRSKGAPIMRVTQVKDSTNTILFTDCAEFSGDKASEFYYLDETETSVHFRHRGHANTLFLDGHVEKLRPYSGTVVGTAGGGLIGRVSAAGSFEMILEGRSSGASEEEEESSGGSLGRKISP